MEIDMAIKGAVKQTIVLRCTDSELFEAAYFVLKGDGAHRSRSDDMLREANRIVAENSFSEKRKRRGGIWRFRMRMFALSALCGGGVVGMMWACFVLMF